MSLSSVCAGHKRIMRPRRGDRHMPTANADGHARKQPPPLWHTHGRRTRRRGMRERERVRATAGACLRVRAAARFCRLGGDAGSESATDETSSFTLSSSPAFSAASLTLRGLRLSHSPSALAGVAARDGRSARARRVSAWRSARQRHGHSSMSLSLQMNLNTIVDTHLRTHSHTCVG